MPLNNNNRKQQSSTAWKPVSRSPAETRSFVRVIAEDNQTLQQIAEGSDGHFTAEQLLAWNVHKGLTLAARLRAGTHLLTEVVVDGESNESLSDITDSESDVGHSDSEEADFVACAELQELERERMQQREGVETVRQRPAVDQAASDLSASATERDADDEEEGYHGVQLSPHGGYSVRVDYAAEGGLAYSGVFQHQLVAARAYDAAARRHHGAGAVLNFPLEWWRKGGRQAFEGVPRDCTKHG
jgi:hypothetical protein